MTNRAINERSLSRKSVLNLTNILGHLRSSIILKYKTKDSSSTRSSIGFKIFKFNNYFKDKTGLRANSDFQSEKPAKPPSIQTDNGRHVFNRKL